jgi:hypothetical protein
MEVTGAVLVGPVMVLATTNVGEKHPAKLAEPQLTTDMIGIGFQSIAKTVSNGTKKPAPILIAEE